MPTESRQQEPAVDGRLELGLRLQDLLDERFTEDPTVVHAGVLVLVVTVLSFVAGLIGILDSPIVRVLWFLGALLSGLISGALFMLRRVTQAVQDVLDAELDKP